MASKNKELAKFPLLNFFVNYKETGHPVDIDDLLNESWANNIAHYDINGFYISSDGQLILADNLGNYVYVPKEEKYIINLFIENDVYSVVY